jgi:hypothetical protein
VLACSPEEPSPVALTTQVKDGRVQFTVPRLLVYAIARIYLEQDGRRPQTAAVSPVFA